MLNVELFWEIPIGKVHDKKELEELYGQPVDVPPKVEPTPSEIFHIELCCDSYKITQLYCMPLVY